MNKEQSISAKPKMNGSMRFYFPNYPDHKLNGMMCWGSGKYEGELNGVKCRKIAYGMDTRGNEFYINPDMFNADRVLVKQWHAEVGTESFYLIK